MTKFDSDMRDKYVREFLCRLVVRAKPCPWNTATKTWGINPTYLEFAINSKWVDREYVTDLKKYKDSRPRSILRISEKGREYLHGLLTAKKENAECPAA